MPHHVPGSATSTNVSQSSLVCSPVSHSFLVPQLVSNQTTETRRVVLHSPSLRVVASTLDGADDSATSSVCFTAPCECLIAVALV